MFDQRIKFGQEEGGAQKHPKNLGIIYGCPFGLGFFALHKLMDWQICLPLFECKCKLYGPFKLETLILD